MLAGASNGPGATMVSGWIPAIFVRLLTVEGTPSPNHGGVLSGCSAWFGGRATLYFSVFDQMLLGEKPFFHSQAGTAVRHKTLQTHFSLCIQPSDPRLRLRSGEWGWIPM